MEQNRRETAASRIPSQLKQWDSGCPFLCIFYHMVIPHFLGIRRIQCHAGCPRGRAESGCPRSHSLPALLADPSGVSVEPPELHRALRILMDPRSPSVGSIAPLSRCMENTPSRQSIALIVEEDSHNETTIWWFCLRFELLCSS